MLAAMYAVARKDLVLMTRYPLMLAARVVEPVGWLLPVYFLGRTFSHGRVAPGFAAWSGTGDYMAFVVVGWMLSSYVVSVLWGMGFSLKNEMDSGVLEANWLTPHPPIVLLVGRTVASVVMTTVVSGVFGILAVALFGISIRGQILPAITFVLPVIIGLYGLGFVLAGFVLLLREANTLIDVSHFLLGLVCGRDFPVLVLPRPVLMLSRAPAHLRVRWVAGTPAWDPAVGSARGRSHCGHRFHGRDAGWRDLGVWPIRTLLPTPWDPRTPLGWRERDPGCP